MNGISILAHQRPEYFAQMTDSLMAIDRTGWDTVITLDRPDQDTVALAVRLADATGATIHVFRNEPAQVPGQSDYDRAYRRISLLTRAAIRPLFQRGADFVLHFEEDLILAPDCLAFAAWAADQYRGDLNVLTVNAWGMAETAKPDLYSTRLVPFFTPWGWGTWRDRWNEMDRRWDTARWDQGLNERIRGQRVGIYPNVARVRNVGVRGTQNPLEWFEREHSERLFFAADADPEAWR